MFLIDGAIDIDSHRARTDLARQAAPRSAPAARPVRA